MPRSDDETLPDPNAVTEVLGGSAGAHGAPGLGLPHRIGDYVLGDVIAEGGCGVVIRARHVASGDAVALKIPHAELAATPTLVARFEREIEAVRRLQHPSVVRILDAGQFGACRPWFAMELLEGEDLQARLATRGRLPVDEAISILESVCAALDAAHAHAIVHRDIKPSNVFICSGEGAPRVILLDFGVAKLLDGTGPELTASRQVVGTLAYLSPEQLMGGPVDLRTDIYGLGGLLYAMLVGRAPLTATAQPVMRQLLLYGGAPKPSLHAPVNPAFDEVVLRAMSRDPSARHPSAAAFFAHARVAAGLGGAPPAPGSTEGAHRALGVYLEVLTEPGALDAPDAQLLDDLESILPAARERLIAEGLSLAVETGTSALFVLDLPAVPALADAARLQLIAAALSLNDSLRARPGRDERVRVHLVAHVGDLVTDADGSPVGGELLDLPAWTSEAPEEGVFATAPLLEGLAPSPTWAAVAEGKLIRLA